MLNGIILILLFSRSLMAISLDVPLTVYIYILSSTVNATLCFALILKDVNDMKTFVCDYHLNDPTTFLHHQIQVYSAHARILALGYKNAFSVLFQHRAQIQNL